MSARFAYATEMPSRSSASTATSIARRSSATPSSSSCRWALAIPSVFSRLDSDSRSPAATASLQRALAVGDGVLEVAAQEPHPRQPRQDQRPHADGLVRGQDRQRPLAGGERLGALVEHPDRPRQPRQQIGVAAGIRGRPELAQRLAQQALGARALAGVAVRAGADLQQVDVADPGHLLGILHARPQLERPIGEVGRLPEREHALRRLRGGDRRAQRRRLLAGRRVVTGDRRLALELLLVVDRRSRAPAGARAPDAAPSARPAAGRRAAPRAAARAGTRSRSRRRGSAPARRPRHAAPPGRRRAPCRSRRRASPRRARGRRTPPARPAGRRATAARSAR